MEEGEGEGISLRVPRPVPLIENAKDSDVDWISEKLAPAFVRAKWRWYKPNGGHGGVFPEAARIAQAICSLAKSSAKAIKESPGTVDLFINSGGLHVEYRDGNLRIYLDPKLSNALNEEFGVKDA